MNKTRRLTLAFVLTLALLAIPTALAAAKELASLTISGPGIQGEVTLDDAKSMMSLQQAGFFDTYAFVKPPEGLGQGYNLMTQLNLDGKIVPFVQIVYYPAAAGQSGYMHWTGRLDTNTMQLNPADEWSSVTPAVGTAFRELMAAHGVTLQVAVAASPASGASAANLPAAQPSPLVLALLGAGLLLIAAALIWRRRVLKPRGASGN